jgi:hypothetical protein
MSGSLAGAQTGEGTRAGELRAEQVFTGQWTREQGPREAPHQGRSRSGGG